jgi:hypothetical protein
MKILKFSLILIGMKHAQVYRAKMDVMDLQVLLE